MEPRHNPLLGTYFTVAGTLTAILGLAALLVYGTFNGGKLSSSTDAFLFGFVGLGVADTLLATLRVRRARRNSDRPQ